jgi:hypothetical protein
MKFARTHIEKRNFVPGNLSRTPHTNPRTHPEERAGDVRVLDEQSARPLLVVVDHGLCTTILKR